MTTVNPKNALRPANQNPWYCLATLYGELELEKNRDLWNRWAVSALGDRAHNALRRVSGAPNKLSDAERDQLYGLYASRTGTRLAPPDPSELIDFSFTAFDHPICFTGYIFGSYLTAGNSRFGDDCNFERAIFLGDAEFGSTVFEKSCRFAHAKFIGVANFGLAEISGVADFQQAEFSADAHFDSAVLHNRSNFASAKFDQDLNFRGAKLRDANFEQAVLGHSADMARMTFEDRTSFALAQFQSADFDHSIFGGFTDFRQAQFSRSGGFYEVQFKQNCVFESSQFCSSSFVDAHFRGSTIFSRAAFQEPARFSGTNFNWCDFSSTSFLRGAQFSFAKFTHRVGFINAQFLGRTEFDAARFEAHVPDFRGAAMHEATEWHGATWPRPPLFRDQAQDQVYAYERLKQEMERLKKHDDEQFFFRKELRARRGLLPFPSGPWLLNFLYEALSNYGSSVLIPSLWLLGLFVAGTQIFMADLVAHRWPFDISTLLRSVQLSFANVFSFLPISHQFSGEYDIANMSSLSQLVSVTQSFLGVILVFLLALAVRSRFRMR